jgi:hypothetical protein
VVQPNMSSLPAEYSFEYECWVVNSLPFTFSWNLVVQPSEVSFPLACVASSWRIISWAESFDECRADLLDFISRVYRSKSSQPPHTVPYAVISAFILKWIMAVGHNLILTCERSSSILPATCVASIHPRVHVKTEDSDKFYSTVYFLSAALTGFSSLPVGLRVTQRTHRGVCTSKAFLLFAANYILVILFPADHPPMQNPRSTLFLRWVTCNQTDITWFLRLLFTADFFGCSSVDLLRCLSPRGVG